MWVSRAFAAVVACWAACARVSVGSGFVGPKPPVYEVYKLVSPYSNPVFNLGSTAKGDLLVLQASYVYCLNNTGGVVWQTYCPLAAGQFKVMGDLVYVGSGGICAVNTTSGVSAWTSTNIHGAYGSATLYTGSGAAIAVSAGSGPYPLTYVWSVNASGAVLWSTSLSSLSSPSPPASIFAGQNTIYAVSYVVSGQNDTETVSAIDASTGNQRWQVSATYPAAGAQSVFSFAYVITLNGKDIVIYGVNPFNTAPVITCIGDASTHGTVLWSIEVASVVTTAVDNNFLYLSTGSGVTAYSVKTGYLVWVSTALADELLPAPASSTLFTMFNMKNTIEAVDSATGHVNWRYSLNGNAQFSAWAVDADGILFAAVTGYGIPGTAVFSFNGKTGVPLFNISADSLFYSGPYQLQVSAGKLLVSSPNWQPLLYRIDHSVPTQTASRTPTVSVTPSPTPSPLPADASFMKLFIDAGCSGTPDLVDVQPSCATLNDGWSITVLCSDTNVVTYKLYSGNTCSGAVVESDSGFSGSCLSTPVCSFNARCADDPPTSSPSPSPAALLQWW